MVTKSTKILLVDDYEDNLFAFQALLQQDGLEVLTATSGKQALEVFLVHEVALALIDVQMPEMDGFELAQLMRGTERTRQIPIVFVTAASRDQRRIFDGYAVGAVDFLFKPIEPMVLRSKVDVFVRLYQQKQELAEHIEAQREMLRVNELLTAAIGHDLRNPLNAVIGAAEIIRRKSQEEQTRWAADRIRAGGIRMAQLIQELLDFSSVRLKGGIPLNPRKFDLQEITRRVVTEHELADSSARIQITSAGDLTVEWDEGRLCQLLSNLIGNALIHGDRQEPVQISLDGSQATDIVFSIYNKGVIPSSVLPGIFDPFKTTGGKHSGSSGLGLGLYIVDQIVKMHTGTIQVESLEPAGTQFTVRLPRVPKIAATPSALSITV